MQEVNSSTVTHCAIQWCWNIIPYNKSSATFFFIQRHFRTYVHGTFFLLALTSESSPIIYERSVYFISNSFWRDVTLVFGAFTTKSCKYAVNRFAISVCPHVTAVIALLFGRRRSQQNWRIDFHLRVVERLRQGGRRWSITLSHKRPAPSFLLVHFSGQKVATENRCGLWRHLSLLSLLKFVKTRQFCLKSHNNNIRHLTWRPACVSTGVSSFKNKKCIEQKL